MSAVGSTGADVTTGIIAVSAEGSTGADVTTGTRGASAVGSLVKLAPTDGDGSSGNRLDVGEMTLGRASSVTV